MKPLRDDHRTPCRVEVDYELAAASASGASAAIVGALLQHGVQVRETRLLRHYMAKDENGQWYAAERTTPNDAFGLRAARGY